MDQDELQRTVNGLWGGILERVELDITQQTMSLYITVLDGGEARAYVLYAEGVSGLSFRNSIPGPWEYADVTEAWLAKREGKVELSLVLWSEDATLTVEAETVRLGDQNVADSPGG